MQPTAGPVVDDPALVDNLRTALLRVGYTSAGVSRVLPAVRLGLSARDLPLYDRQVPSGEPLPTLIRLFLLGLSVPEPDVTRALSPVNVGHLVHANLVTSADGIVTSLTQLLCIGDLLLFGDRDDAILDQPGWVSASSPTAQVLDFLTVPRHGRSALDLGCGAGMHALVAARRNDTVTATDVNLRAIAFTRFNARLNQVTNLVCREGSWFEPVADEQFDLIVSNPPFVVSPDATLPFRDGALPADDVSRLIVTQAAAHLREGGYGHVLCNWAVREGERWDAAPQRWLQNVGCDALVVHFSTDDPLPYAAVWNAPLRTRDQAAFEAALDRWVTYYSSSGITALCGGAIVMRRRSAHRRWMRTLTLRQAPEGAAGEDVLRLFEGQDLLESPATDGLLEDEVFELADRHEVRQVLQHRGGAYNSQRCTVARPAGLGLEVEVDPEALQVILRLDGHHTLRELTGRVANELGLEASRLLEKATAAVRDLVRGGFLTRRMGLDERSEVP